MSKVFTSLAVAAAITLGAAPAVAQAESTQSVTLSLAGKTPAKIHAEI